jgi:hypothetical protein
MEDNLSNDYEYPFRWLDELVEITLNPDKVDVTKLSFENLKFIGDKIPLEFSKISCILKKQAFTIYETDHIRAAAGHYDIALRELKRQMQNNMERFPANGLLYDTGRLLLHMLNELYQDIHRRFDPHLTTGIQTGMSKRCYEEQTYPFYWLDETVEITLNPDRSGLKSLQTETLEAIKQRLPREITTITFHLKTQAFCLYSNDQIKVVAGHYDQTVKALQQQAARNLTRYPKSGLLRQVGEMINKALNELATCLYSRYPAYLPPQETPVDTPPNSGGLLNKILCTLSADQAGIILRAATDAGILVGRSFSKVCQAIAPFLSTPWKKDIKPDTLRSHATRPESRDKEVAIAFLEKMIDKIKGYR